MGRKVSGKTFAARISVNTLFGEDNTVDKNVVKWRGKQSGNWYHAALDFDYSSKTAPEYADYLKKEGRQLAEDLTELEKQEEIDPRTWYALTQRASQMKAYLKAFNDSTNRETCADPKIQAMEGLLSGVERVSESFGAAAKEEEYRGLEQEIRTKQEALTKAREDYAKELKEFTTQCRAYRISPDCLNEPVYGAMTNYAKRQSSWLANARQEVNSTLENHTVQLNKELEQQKLPSMAVDYMLAVREVERLRREEAAGKKPEEKSEPGPAEKKPKTPLQQAEEKLKAMEAALAKQEKRAGYGDKEKLTERLKKAAGGKEKPAELLDLAKKEVAASNSRVNKPEEDSPELRKSRRKMAGGEQTLLESIDRQGNFLKDYRGALLGAAEKRRKLQKSYEELLKSEAELGLSLKKVPKKNTVNLDKNIKNGLKDFLEQMKTEKMLTESDERTYEHSNSFAYRKMGKRIKDALEKGYIDAKSLKEISKAAGNYLDSKGKELNFRPFSTNMRHRRLDMARNLKRFADNSIEQLKERAYAVSKGTEKQLQSMASVVEKQSRAPARESFDRQLSDAVGISAGQTQEFVKRRVDGKLSVIEEKLSQRSETYLKEKNKLSEKERGQLAVSQRLQRRPGSDEQSPHYAETDEKIRRDLEASRTVVKKKPEKPPVQEVKATELKKPAVTEVKPVVKKNQKTGPVLGGPVVSH